MTELLKQAKALQSELTGYRRYLHKNAEVGFELTKTMTFVRSELEKTGYAVEELGGALLTGVGKKTGRTFLLRADADGLPIAEKTGLSFACKQGNMHACGHDMHTAMLLGAAKLLKDREARLNGRILLLFQPAEEILEGAKSAIEHGVLSGVDGAMTLHVMTDSDMPTGSVVVASEGVSAPAADYFTVRVKGKGCHGSAPWNGVDALTVAAHILLALQEIPARELSLSQPAVLTVGALKTHTAGNAIGGFAELVGSLRAFDEETRRRIKTRLEEISRSVAKAFRASAKVVYGGGCPTLVNDGELSALALSTAKSLLGKGVFSSADLASGERARNGGSEDFAYISHKVPSVMLALAAGERRKDFVYPLHHSKTDFDESALPVGSALYAAIAQAFLGKTGISL